YKNIYSPVAESKATAKPPQPPRPPVVEPPPASSSKKVSPKPAETITENDAGDVEVVEAENVVQEKNQKRSSEPAPTDEITIEDNDERFYPIPLHVYSV